MAAQPLKELETYWNEHLGLFCAPDHDSDVRFFKFEMSNPR